MNRVHVYSDDPRIEVWEDWTGERVLYAETDELGRQIEADVRGEVAYVSLAGLTTTAESYFAGEPRYIVVDPDDLLDRGLEAVQDAEQQQVEDQRKEQSNFVSLHTHTEFSTLDGLTTLPELVSTVAAHGDRAVCVSDHGNVAAHPSLQIECDKQGIKPIFGMEAYFVPDRHRRPRSWLELNDVEVSAEHLSASEKAKAKKVSDAAEVKSEYTHLVLIAQTQKGLENLWAMSTESYREGLYDGKPRLDWDTLQRFAEGVVCLTGCLRGPVARPLVEDDLDRARENLLRLYGIFTDRLYVEIHTNHLEDQIKANRGLIDLAREYRIPLVAAVDSHYALPEHQEVHDIWVRMQTGKTLTEDTSMFGGQQDYHLKSEAEVRSALDYLPVDVVEEAVTNTVLIAESCHARVGADIHPPIFTKPSETYPDEKSRIAHDVERLRAICADNWMERLGDSEIDQEVLLDRFDQEMGVLTRLNFCGYYLVVHEYVNWAKDRGCLIGPSRGSGGGSLVAYIAKITEIEPVSIGLPFERFINEGRKSMPDFDCVSGSTEFHRDGGGDYTVEGLYIKLHGRVDAEPGECEVCGTPMDSIKKGYMGNPSSWLCVPCYKSRHHLTKKGLPSILGRNILGRLSNQPLLDIIYRGVRETIRITVSDGRCIESTPEHRHLTTRGWMEAQKIKPGDLVVMMDDKRRRASHTDNLSATAKRRLLERANYACESCHSIAPEGVSWLGKFEVAHLDYSTQNIENMLFLCVPCHRRMDGQLGTPVVFRTVSSVEDSGTQPVYDVVMGHDDHSWVANGFVTHNCDFPTSWRDRVLGHFYDYYGADHITNIGTVGRLRSKSAIDSVVRVMRPTLNEEIPFIELTAVKALIDAANSSLAGKQLPWDEFCAQYPDVLESLRTRFPQVFSTIDLVVDRVKSYGKHAAGVVISTDTPLTYLPMRLAKDTKTGREVMVSQFDMEALEALGYVKFDILTVRTLDTLQECIDLVAKHTGIKIDPYKWKDEYTDPLVWDEISAGHTLGMFQIETTSGTALIRRMKPRNMAELADAITIVRPGPDRSGLKDAYLRRRAGLEPITYLHPDLEPILSSTQGTMIYQEQVMAVCRELAGYSSTEADDVRKLLGKKQVEKAAAAGQEFVSRAIKQGISSEIANTLWKQMEEFSRYCVTGDTKVHLAASGRSSDGTITAEELWRRINAPLLPPGPVGRAASKLPKYDGPCVVCDAQESSVWIRGACRACYVWRQKFRDVRRGLYGLVVEADSRIRPGRILTVHKHEPAEVFEVVLEDGRTISATANHRHLTPDGLRRVDQLAVGDELVVDGGYEKHQYEPSESRTTVGDRLLAGAVNGCFGKENYGYIDGGFASLMAWTAQAPDHCEECGHDGSEHRLERAHLDGVRSNNLWDNLKMLCVSCHKKHDYAYNERRRRWGKGRLVSSSKIVSISSRGSEPVYSVVFDDPHIWIANGIATENSFNLSHAYGYALIAYWCGWLRHHFPSYHLTSLLSTVDDDRIPAFIEDCRNSGYRIVPPHINRSQAGFTTDGIDMVYGLESVKGLGAAPAQHIVAKAPYVSVEDFRTRAMAQGSPVNMGHLRALVAVGAFDSLYPHRRALELTLDWEMSPEAKACVHKTDHPVPTHPFKLPCGFDWANEPDPPMLPRGRGKAKVYVPKDPPKSCTVRCRQYLAPSPPDPDRIEPYSHSDIYERERELLGVWVTYSPFESIPEEILKSEDVATGLVIQDAPVNTEWVGITLVEAVKKRVDRNGNDYAFFTLNMQDSTFDAVCFSSTWEEVSSWVHPGGLGTVVVRKTPRGYTVMDYLPIN